MGRFISGEVPWRRFRVVQGVPNPAAGADWSVIVPAGHLWELMGVTASLLTSAVVANRAVAIVLGDGTNPYLTIPAAAVQAASLAGVYSWAGDAGTAALGARQYGPLPDLSVPAGWTIGSSSLLLDAGDQWSAIRLAILDVTMQQGPLDLPSVQDQGVDALDLALAQGG